MDLVKLIDVEGETHYVNSDFVHIISPWQPMKMGDFTDDPMDNAICVVVYGSGYSEHAYLSLPVSEVAIMFGYLD